VRTSAGSEFHILGAATENARVYLNSLCDSDAENNLYQNYHHNFFSHKLYSNNKNWCFVCWSLPIYTSAILISAYYPLRSGQRIFLFSLSYSLVRRMYNYKEHIAHYRNSQKRAYWISPVINHFYHKQLLKRESNHTDRFNRLPVSCNIASSVYNNS